MNAYCQFLSCNIMIYFGLSSPPPSNRFSEKIFPHNNNLTYFLCIWSSNTDKDQSRNVQNDFIYPGSHSLLLSDALFSRLCRLFLKKYRPPPFTSHASLCRVRSHDQVSHSLEALGYVKSTERPLQMQLFRQPQYTPCLSPMSR